MNPRATTKGAPLWMTVTQLAHEMGCTRATAYARIRRLEKDSHHPVLVQRTVQGKKIFTISRADAHRARTAIGIVEDPADSQQILEELEAIKAGQVELMRRLNNLIPR